jgi:ketosteroid isomerase-like protein
MLPDCNHLHLMTKVGRFVTLLVAVPLLACSGRTGSSAPPASPTDSAAVLAAYEQYRQAWLRGDTAAALGLISDDIRILISGVPDVVGKEATRKLFVDEMTKYEVPLLRLNHHDVILSGDHAIVVGTYEEIQMPKQGAPIRGTGRYTTIWRREPGGWHIVRYMLNELPPENPRR